MARYAIIALIVTTLLGVLSSKLLYDKYTEAKVEITKLETSLEVEKAKNERAIREAAALESSLSGKTDELRKIEKYLEAMKGREATIVAKPEWTQKLIQQAVRKREAQFECATGGLCEQP